LEKEIRPERKGCRGGKCSAKILSDPGPRNSFYLAIGGTRYRKEGLKHLEHAGRKSEHTLIIKSSNKDEVARVEVLTGKKELPRARMNGGPQGRLHALHLGENVPPCPVLKPLAFSESSCIEGETRKNSVAGTTM